MKEEILQYVRKVSENRRIGIWGTGKKAAEVIKIVDDAGIEISAFIDNDASKRHSVFNGKIVLSPTEISKEWYVLIGMGYSPQIIPQLNDMGFVEGEDFIAILELDFYEALSRHRDAPRVPDVTMEVLQNITNEIIHRVPYEYVTWFDEEKFAEFEGKFGADILYNKKYSVRYRRKLMEHFCAYQLLR